MSAPDSRSGRCSARVEPVTTNTDVTPPAAVVKGPESLPLRVPPAAPVAAASERRRRVSARRLARLDRDLSDRERAVLTGLADYHFLTTGQLQRLHFAMHASEGAASRICRRVLARLAQLGVIEHLERRVGGVRAGSASYVWRVGPIGDRLLRQAAGEGSRARRKQPSLRYLEHCLAVADCSLTLVEAHRAGRIELLRAEPEPACWRSYLGPHGGSEMLKPDLAAVTAIGEFEDAWFIEVDRGTESLPTVLAKCAQYEAYRRSGREQAGVGVFPAVLWVVPDEARQRALVAALRRTHRLDDELFRVTTTELFAATICGGAA